MKKKLERIKVENINKTNQVEKILSKRNETKVEENLYEAEIMESKHSEENYKISINNSDVLDSHKESSAKERVLSSERKPPVLRSERVEDSVRSKEKFNEFASIKEDYEDVSQSARREKASEKQSVNKFQTVNYGFEDKSASKEDDSYDYNFDDNKNISVEKQDDKGSIDLDILKSTYSKLEKSDKAKKSNNIGSTSMDKRFKLLDSKNSEDEVIDG